MTNDNKQRKGDNKMKLWEVIKALTEDPTKRFETKLASKGWTACMRVDTGFSRYFKFEVFNGKRLVDQSRDGGAFNGNVELDLDWQLVRQPVQDKDDVREGCQMKIEDCKTLPKFFGVNIHDHIWVEGKRFKVFRDALGGEQSAPNEASRALVGCLTGQLKWSTTEPMTADEEKVLREIAAWFPWWGTIYISTKTGNILIDFENGSWYVPFAESEANSKAYEVLAPILEKYGEIDLDEYREE